ncbi:chaplin, partial [Streptomyces sp. NPDC048737]
MRQTLSRAMVAAAAATSILSLYGGSALADSHAGGIARNSPGAVSGTSAEVPLTVPANACGDSADVAAALTPPSGDSCANTPGDTEKDRSHETSSSGDGGRGYGGSESGEEEPGYGDSQSGEEEPGYGGSE